MDDENDPMFSPNHFLNSSNFSLALDSSHLGLNILNIDDPLLSSSPTSSTTSSPTSMSTPSSLSPSSKNNSLVDLSNCIDPIILTTAHHQFLSTSPNTLKRLYSETFNHCDDNSNCIDSLLHDDDSLVRNIDIII